MKMVRSIVIVLLCVFSALLTLPAISLATTGVPELVASGVQSGSINSLGEAVWSQYDPVSGQEQIFSSTRGQLTTDINYHYGAAINNLGDVVWLEHNFETGRDYVRGTIGGRPVTLGGSWTQLTGVDINDHGEVVWGQESPSAYSQIHSNFRGIITSGDIDHYAPSINNDGDVVFIQSSQIYKMPAGSSTAVMASTGSLLHGSPSINDGGEILWLERENVYPQVPAQLVSSVRGVLPLPEGVDIDTVDSNNCGDLLYADAGLLYRLGANAPCVTYPEPNDTQAQASSVAFGGTFTGVVDSAANAVDWYRFTAAAGENIRITVNFDNRAPNVLAIGLYDDQGNLLSGPTSSSPLGIIAAASYSGAFYLKTTGEAGRIGYAVALSKSIENCGTSPCPELVATDVASGSGNSMGEVVWSKFDKDSGDGMWLFYSSLRGQLTVTHPGVLYEPFMRVSPAVNNLGDMVWVDFGDQYSGFYMLRGMIGGEPVELAYSQYWIGEPSINDRGEVVWAQADQSSVKQIVSNLRGQLTSGALSHYTPSINNNGDVVFVQYDASLPGPGQIYKLAVGTSAAVAVTSDALDHRTPAINDAGEIVWTVRDSNNPGVTLQAVSSVRGLLPVTGEIFSLNLNNCGHLVYSITDDRQQKLYRLGSNACVSYPEANETQAQATAVEFGGIFTGLVDSAANPVDWYRFDAAVGDTVRITVNYDGTAPNVLTVGLYDGQGNLLSGPTGSNPLVIAASAGYSGSYYLKAEGAVGQFGYAVSLSKYNQECGNGPCPELLGTFAYDPSINSLGEVVWSQDGQFFSSTRGQLTFDTVDRGVLSINNLGDSVWVEKNFAGFAFALRGTIGGQQVTLATSQYYIGRTDINDLGEVVWIERDAAGLYTLHSNVRGQLTDGISNPSRASLNNHGDLVFLLIDPSQPGPRQIYKIAAGSTNAVAVTSDSTEHAMPAINDGGEIVWVTTETFDSYYRHKIVSSVRGVLPVQIAGYMDSLDLNNCGSIAYTMTDQMPSPRLYRQGSSAPCLAAPERAFALGVGKSAAGAGNGEVLSSDAGVSLSSADNFKMAAFSAGATVTLTASPDANSLFTGWAGACSGTGVCQVTMDLAKSVQAIFEPIDTTPPTVTITSPAAGLSNNSTPVLSYTVSDGVVVVKVDGAAVSKVSGDTLDTLADGTHTVRVESTDAAGNASFAEASFTIDATAPVVGITSPASGVTADNTPLLSYTAGDGNVVVKVDGVAVAKVSGASLDALANGSHTLQVESTDAAGNIGAASVTFTVDYTPLTVSTSSLAWGTTGVAYSQALAASGGVPAYTWSVVSGALPDGLSLNPSSGAITGVSAATGSFAFTVQAADSDGASATRSLTVVIYAPLNISTTSLSSGYAVESYSQTLAATGGAGQYNWTISSGTLPAGLSLDASTGIVSGTPSTSGTSAFTVQVTDSNQTAASQALSITINGSRPDLVVTTVSGATSVTRGKKTTMSATVKNQGAGTAAASTVMFYLSSDSTITTGDLKIAEASIGSLTSGSSQTVNLSVTVPTSVATGTYFIGAVADGAGVVAEANEANNGKAGNSTLLK